MNLIEGKELAKAKLLYHHAFPKEERLPWWVLRLMTAKTGVELTTYYDKSKFVGFVHTTVTQNMLFIMFFAVQEDIQGNGYGSAILEHLKQKHAGKVIIVNVEPLDDHAENADQRRQRMRFYEKNGFFDTGYDIAEVGGIFRILSTNRELNPNEYLQVFRKLSFGFWRPKITRTY